VGIVTVGLAAAGRAPTGRTERRLQRIERDPPGTRLPARRPVIGLLPHPRHPQGRGSSMISPQTTTL
jgi:hypothetical protein